MSVWPPEGSPLAVTPEMEQMMKKMNYPVIKVTPPPRSSPLLPPPAAASPPRLLPLLPRPLPLRIFVPSARAPLSSCSSACGHRRLPVISRSLAPLTRTRARALSSVRV